jgi:hypothetical protein
VLREDALKLLNAAAVEHLLTKRARTYKEARRELDTIDLALGEGSRLAERLRLQEGAAKLEAHADDLREAMRQYALSLISAERSLQARDAILDKIGVRQLTREFDDLVPGNRLSNTASAVFRFLDAAALRGWISVTEFNQAFTEARRAGGFEQ